MNNENKGNWRSDILKWNTLVSIIIISFLFLISVIVIIAGYKFSVSFSGPNADMTALEIFTNASRGITFIIIGVFLVLLVLILILDIKLRDIKEDMDVYRHNILHITYSIYETQKKTNKILESLVAPQNTKEYERLQQILSKKNENIENIISNIDAFQNEIYTLQNKVNRLNKEIQDLNLSKEK